MKKTQQHTIDVLFPISLFVIFAATALVILLLSANIYQGVVSDSEHTFERSTSLSYLCEKIRQQDEGQISLTTFDGNDALAISQTFGEQTYTTYIYEINGELKEIFLQDGVSASAQNGTTILAIGDLQMEQLTDQLFRFTCTSKDGQSDSVLISVQSTK